MKDNKTHRVLWHKRNQLRIEDNAQQDWSDMKAILDMQMPVSTPGAAAGGSSATGLSGLAGVKIVSAILAALSVAASLTYFILKNNHTNQHTDQKTVKAIKQDRAGPAPATLHSPLQSLDSGSGTNYSSAGTGSNATVLSNNDARPVSSPAHSKEYDAINSNAATATGGIASPGKRNTVSADHKNHSDINPTGATQIGGIVSSGGHNTLSAHHKNNRAISPAGAMGTGGVVNPGDRNTAGQIKSGPGSRRFNKTGNNIASLHNGVSSHAVITGAHTRHSVNNSRKTGGLSVSTKYRGGHPHRTGITSRYVKNSALNGSSQKSVTSLAPDNRIPPTNPISERYDELGRLIAGGFVAPRYGISPLPGYLTGLFKNTYSMPMDTPGLDFGVHFIMGVNPSGSFTARDQNINFYGRFPVDVFFGLTGIINFSDQWGASVGIRALTPRNISGSYSHKNESKKDTLQTLNISDSRKLYFLDIPVNAMFKPSSDFNIKAGMVFSIPVQEANGNSTFQTGKLQKDTLYYKGVQQNINATTYTRGLIFGLSAGVGYQQGRFIFDASYTRYLNILPITSPLGSYNAGSNEFLFTVGFRLNKPKK